MKVVNIAQRTDELHEAQKRITGTVQRYIGIPAQGNIKGVRNRMIELQLDLISCNKVNQFVTLFGYRAPWEEHTYNLKLDKT